MEKTGFSISIVTYTELPKERAITGYSENVKFMAYREVTSKDPCKSALGLLFDISISDLSTKPGLR